MFSEGVTSLTTPFKCRYTKMVIENVLMIFVLFRWRTKQNLDYSFLMMYAVSKGVYYVQVRP